jgi:nucleoid-associated protein YgaU
MSTVSNTPTPVIIPPQTPLAFPAQTTVTPPVGNATTPETATIAPQDKLSFGSLSGTQANGAPHFTEYQVKRGDTLSKIAQNLWGSSANYMDIYEANKDILRNPNDLHVGMTLKIPTPSNSVDFPIGKPVEAPPAEPVQTTEQPPAIETPPADPPAADATQTSEQPPVTDGPPAEPPAPQFTEVTVKPGESLSILALRHLGDSERYPEIYEANKDILSSPEAVRAGMTLKIPTSTAKPSDETGEASAVAEAGPLNTEGMTPRAAELYEALKKYQTHHAELGNANRTQTTDAEMREIAIELDKAGEAFGVDPKIMMAVYAHESGGFNPRARSNTGAGGLGQLTGIAIRQVHYMAGMAKGQRGREPFTQFRDNFVQSETKISQRYDIKQNIWTSTAYMAYEIKDRNNGNVERALERYGDPNVSTYENKVNSEYRTLFGTDLF